jgi:hypothetical protein
MAEPLSGAGNGHNYFGSVTQARFLAFLDGYNDADNEVKDATARRKNVQAEIEATGVPWASFKKMRRDIEKSGEVREREDAWYRQMMLWQSRPVGFQATMDAFDDPNAQAVNVHEMKRVDAEGFEAGKAGRRRDSNSYTPGTEMAQRFDVAWMRGQAEIAASMGPGSTAANGERRGRGRPKGSHNKVKQAEAAMADEAGAQGSGEQVH